MIYCIVNCRQIDESGSCDHAPLVVIRFQWTDWCMTFLAFTYDILVDHKLSPQFWYLVFCEAFGGHIKLPVVKSWT